MHLLGEAAPEHLFVPEKRQQAWPLKTSVSALIHQQQQGENLLLLPEEEEVQDKRAEETPLRLSELPARPSFLEEKRMTAAERGTLTHRALSLLPLDALRTTNQLASTIAEAIAQMEEKHIFTLQEVAAIDQRTLVGYFASPIGQRMLHSPLVQREWAFNLLLDKEKGMLLQGVIDCAFREQDGWVLVDYKTDHITDEAAFVTRYASQMAWYARALQTITGETVKECLLYALRTGKAYPVKENE